MDRVHNCDFKNYCKYFKKPNIFMIEIFFYKVIVNCLLFVICYVLMFIKRIYYKQILISLYQYSDIYDKQSLIYLYFNIQSSFHFTQIY